MKWLAPEVLRSKSFTTMSDVWAFGVMVWEVLTRGLLPYGTLNGWNGIFQDLQKKICEAFAVQKSRVTWTPVTVSKNRHIATINFMIYYFAVGMTKEDTDRNSLTWQSSLKIIIED